MDGVKLKLNLEKTEFIIISNRQRDPHAKNSQPTSWRLNLSYQYSQEPRCYLQLGQHLYQSHKQSLSCQLLSPQGPKTHPQIPQCGDCSPACKLNDQQST